MSDIVDRLRQHALPDPHDEREVLHAPLLSEAADIIEAQRQQLAECQAWKDDVVNMIATEVKTARKQWQCEALLEAATAMEIERYFKFADWLRNTAKELE